MNLSRRWIWTAGFSVIFVSTLSAQAGGPVTAPPPPGFAAVGGTMPPVGDPAVFFMFLRYYDSLVQDLQKDALADPATAQTRRQGAATSLGLNGADFEKIHTVSQALVSALAIVDQDANAYRDSVWSRKEKPDIAMIKQFSARRDQAVANARSELQKALTQPGWQALSTYIEGSFRQTIVRRSIGQ